jgi:hypothetical protein
MLTKKNIYGIQEKLFDIFIIISWILVVISALGFSQDASKFLQDLDYYVRIYICLFLIWRFNPFKRHYEFTNLDRKIAFSAGMFILTTTALNQYLEKFKNTIKKYLP